MKKLKQNKILVKIIGFITYFLIFYFFTCIILLALGGFFIKPLYDFIHENVSYAYVIYPMFFLFFLIPFYSYLSEDNRQKTINYKLNFQNYKELIKYIDKKLEKLKLKKYLSKDNDKTIYYGFSSDRMILKCMIIFKFEEIMSTEEELEIIVSNTVNNFLEWLKKNDKQNMSIAYQHNYSFVFWVEKENKIFNDIVETYFARRGISFRYTLTIGISNDKKRISIFNPISQFDEAMYHDFLKILDLKKKDKLD